MECYCRLDLQNDPDQQKTALNYALALGFGLVHGLGFSTLLRAMIAPGDSVVTPLFAFNVGVELGQVLIVAIIMFIAYLVMNIFKAKQRD